MKAHLDILSFSTQRVNAVTQIFCGKQDRCPTYLSLVLNSKIAPYPAQPVFDLVYEKCPCSLMREKLGLKINTDIH